MLSCVSLVLLMTIPVVSIGCGTPALPVPTPGSTTPHASSSITVPSIENPTQESASSKARCALQMLDVCRAPGEDGAVELCGTGRPPIIGQRYMLFDAHRVRHDIGSVVVHGVSADLPGRGFRASGTTSLKWLEADEGPLGAIGPWDDALKLSGGIVVWGELVTELRMWGIGLTLDFLGGEHFQLRAELESCDTLMLQTRFFQSDRWCITETRTGPQTFVSRASFFVGVPRICAPDGGAPRSHP